MKQYFGKEFLGDKETKILNNEEKFKDYIEFRKENDEWVTAPIHQLAVHGEPNSPLSMMSQSVQIKADYHGMMMPLELVMNNAAKECLEESGIFLMFPKDGTIFFAPIRNTAYSTICSLADVGGGIISRWGNTNKKLELPVQEKAALLSRGFSLYRESNGTKCKILLRDGKVSACLPDDYAAYPIDELIEALEHNLRLYHPDMQFGTASSSQELLAVQYFLNDKELNDEVHTLLIDMGFRHKTVNCGVCFATSDIGTKKMYLYPFYIIDEKHLFRLGEVKCLANDSNNTLEAVKDRFSDMEKVLSENLSLLQTFGTKQVDCVAGTVNLQAETRKDLFSTQGTMDIIHELRLSRAQKGSFFDVYIALSDIINRSRKGDTMASKYFEAIKKLEEYAKEVITNDSN